MWNCYAAGSVLVVAKNNIRHIRRIVLFRRIVFKIVLVRRRLFFFFAEYWLQSFLKLILKGLNDLSSQ